jgi:hypothetical protein
VPSASNISALSKLVVQVSEPMFARIFRSIPEAIAIFQTKQFALIPPYSFFCLLSSPPEPWSWEYPMETYSKLLVKE